MRQGWGMQGEATRLLRDIRSGQPGSVNALLCMIYHDLHEIADQLMRHERADHTLQPTILVNESFLRLIGQEETEWKSRAHFLAVAARQMRRILIDHAKGHNAQKRGGGVNGRVLREDAIFDSTERAELLALHEALERLHRFNPQGAAVVELRFFAGMTSEEIAEYLQVSKRTVAYKWESARAWLAKELRPSDESGG